MDAASLTRIRGWIGEAAPPTDEEIEEKFGQLGDARSVVHAVLSARLAAILGRPTNYSVQGDYAQDDVARIAGLRDQLNRLRRWRPDLSSEIPLSPVEGGPGHVRRIVRRGNRF